MSDMNQVASDLYKALTESDERKPQSYDTKATVLREEGNIVWVKIPGGIDETPVQKTNNANPGDEVIVRLSGGRAYVLGNNTSPATDDTVANEAYAQSNDAVEAAIVSQTSAEIARSSAEKAQELAQTVNSVAQAAIRDADIAAQSASFAKDQADSALNSASIANTSANAAVYQLSEVEKVVDALGWIAEHGTYALTNDTIINPGKWYFVQTGTGGYAVGTPVSNPHDEGFYELSSIDSAVSNYITTHVYLVDGDGLYVRMDKDLGAKVKITGTGVYLINPSGETIAQYTDVVILGDPNSSHIELSPIYGLGFYQGTKQEDSTGAPTNRVAYIQSDRLFIQSATLTNNLQIGNFRWVVLDHRISLKYNPIS